MKRMRSEYDLAHGCFLFCGLTALIIAAMSAIPMDDGTAGGLGFLVIIPLSLASLAAIVVGIVLSVRIWNEWALVILSGMSLLFIAEVFTEYGSTAFYNAVPVAYGIGVTAISVVWFLVLRRRRFP
jgi:hypothetical protein